MNEIDERQSCYIRHHNHEVTGSTRIAGCCNEAHNHRFTTVSGDPISKGNSHVHEVRFNTDSCDGHKHEFCGLTGPAVKVDEDHHVHYLESCTTMNEGHKHEFAVATLIEDPTCEEECECRRRDRDRDKDDCR